MVLYFNHCHASNMYPTSNRHPSHQSFGLASYGYPGQQSSQYGPPSNMGDMGCAMAQYQMSGLGNMSDGIQQAGQGLSMPTSWHSPAVYTMSSCSRGSMFDEWATGHSQGQPPLSSSPCQHGPFSVSTASHHSAASSPSCNFGGYKLNGPTNLSGAVTPTPLGSSPGVIHHHGLHGSSGVSVNNGNSDPSVSNVNNGASGANNGHGTGSSGVNSASNNSDQEYSSQVQVQDLTHAGGHHSPDSGLTVSSDGVSSSDSPQHISGSAAHALHHHNHHHHHHHPTTAHHNNPGPTVTRPTPVRSPFEWMKPTKPSYQSQPNPEAVSIHPSERFFTSKTRTKDKYRVVYSDHQRLELEKEFHYSRYITIRRKAELAQMLGLSERQVKIWFQNRRAKERKQGKKREESKNKDGSVMMQPGQLHAPPGVLLPTKIINLE